MMKLKSLIRTAALFVAAILPFAANLHAAETKVVKPYPLKTCLVSGEKLGSMGEPFVYQHENREIKFCCKGCLKDFNKAPNKFLKELEKAEKKPASP